MIGIMLNDVNYGYGPYLLEGERVWLTYADNISHYFAKPVDGKRHYINNDGETVTIYKGEVFLISIEELHVENETAWHYAIWKYGEEGLWLGKQDGNIKVYKYGVLKDTF